MEATRNPFSNQSSIQADLPYALMHLLHKDELSRLMLSYTCRMYNEAYQRYHRGKISYDDFEFDVTRPKTCYKREFAITGKAKRPQLVLIARPVKEQEWEMIVHRGSTFVLEVMERFVRPEAKISKTGFFTIKTMSMSTKDYIGASTPNGCQVTAVSGGGGFGHYSKETWSRPTEGAGIGVGFTLRDIRDIVTGRYEGNPSADYEGHRRRVRICVLAFDGGDPFNLLDAAVDCDNDEQLKVRRHPPQHAISSATGRGRGRGRRGRGRGRSG